MNYDATADYWAGYDACIDAKREMHEAILAAGAKRIEYVGDSMLIEGDCLGIMPALGKVDHVICDPPYEQHMHAAKRGKKAYGAARRIRTDGHANPPPVEFSSIDGIRDAAADLCASASSGWVLVFCTPEGVAAWRDALENAGTRYKRACVWVKPDSAPQFNGQGPAMGAEMFCVAWAGQGFSRWNGGGRRNVWTHLCQPSDRHGAHPTEKPTSLMRDLVRDFTNTAQTILDPFMGSGTTGVAALQLGRRFIGIELDPGYFDIAVKRCKEAWSQPRLFDEPKAKPPETGNLFGGDPA